jgi:hypothetical protein
VPPPRWPVSGLAGRFIAFPGALVSLRAQWLVVDEAECLL